MLNSLAPLNDLLHRGQFTIPGTTPDSPSTGMTGAAVAAPLSVIFVSMVYHSFWFALAYLVSVSSTIPGLTGSHIEPSPGMELEFPPRHIKAHASDFTPTTSRTV